MIWQILKSDRKPWNVCIISIKKTCIKLCLPYCCFFFLGLFMRHMLLAYNKLSFSQVYKLYKSLQHYYHSHYAKPTDGQVSLPALVADDSDMDLTSTEDTVGDRIDKEELDTPLHESELRWVMLFLDKIVSFIWCNIFYFQGTKPSVSTSSWKFLHYWVWLSAPVCFMKCIHCVYSESLNRNPLQFGIWMSVWPGWLLTADSQVLFFLFSRSDNAPSRGPLSQKQAEYFLARQVSV